MPVFASRLLSFARTRLRGWRLPLGVAGFVFATSWLAMWLVEPASNEISRPAIYWWWFLVTAATVGYGDFFPVSTGGRLVGGYVIVGGIVTLTILFTQLATYLQTARGKRMKGQVPLDIRGHTVVLGYTPGRTERLLSELCSEDRLDLVLCAGPEVAEHPIPEREQIRFVRGELTDLDVLSRACVGAAKTVVVDVRDDNETLAIAVAIDHVNPDVHLVAALQDMTRRQQLRYVNPKVQCVQWHMPNLISDEAQDPGIAQVYADLMTSEGPGNTYSMVLPATRGGITFGQCQTEFGRRFAATVVGVRRGDELLVSPGWDTELDTGAVLYYVAGQRIDIAELAATGR